MYMSYNSNRFFVIEITQEKGRILCLIAFDLHMSVIVVKNARLNRSLIRCNYSIACLHFEWLDPCPGLLFDFLSFIVILLLIEIISS